MMAGENVDLAGTSFSAAVARLGPVADLAAAMETLATLPPPDLEPGIDTMAPFTAKRLDAPIEPSAAGVGAVGTEKATELVLYGKERLILAVELTVVAPGHVFVAGQFDAQMAHGLTPSGELALGFSVYGRLVGAGEVSVGSLVRTSTLTATVTVSHLLPVSEAGTHTFGLLAVSMGWPADHTPIRVYNRTLSAFYVG
jgi:hypothetical protein